MPFVKFAVGEKVEMLCRHIANGRPAEGWLAGTVVEADHRMAAVKCEADVYSSNGWLIPDRILWCAHGSRNIRRRNNALQA
ncbi:MAG: hypothetical protein HYZ35_02760 [Chloroflexi bacterium]|nr:hypothetical protein [Chloroflexota bacterium]